jgi:signal transduction histidine kinase
MQGLAKLPTRISKFVPHSSDVTPKRLSPAPGTPVPILKPERFDQLAHDARNVLSALRLYCDLLAEPGVLTSGHGHYAQELQAVTETASRLVERLAAPRRRGSRRSLPKRHQNSSREVNAPLPGQEPRDAISLAEPWPGDTTEDIGCELRSMRPLLAAIAGPRIDLKIEALPCGGRTWLSKEDLTRVMLNLVRNASEAMPEEGKLRITAQYGDGLSFLEAGRVPDTLPHSVVIAVEDSGPGIPEDLREEIFKAGFTTRATGSNWPEIPHHGLGLSIVRSLIEAAGGTALARSSPGGGARFELELPITSGMYEIIDTRCLVADSSAKGCIECP